MATRKDTQRKSLWARLTGGAGGGKRRRGAAEAPGRWIKPALGGGALLCVMGAAAGSGLWLVQSGTLDRWQQAVEAGISDATRDTGLALAQVYVIGRRQTDREAILDALDAEIGTPILNLDPDAIRARLEDLGWIADARVERRLPDTLVLRIAERKAAAIWQQDRKLVLIDRDGAVIGPEDVPQHRHLKLVVGEGAPEEAAHLLDVLEREPALKARVIAAVWMGERRWNLRLDNGIDVRLPETDPEGAWKRLARLDRDHDILARAVDAIDLRQPDRLIVRMTEDGAMQINARRNAKDT